MKSIKTFIISIIAITLFGSNLGWSKEYAVLISAGEATGDNLQENSEYWYDLFF